MRRCVGEASHFHVIPFIFLKYKHDIDDQSEIKTTNDEMKR